MCLPTWHGNPGKVGQNIIKRKSEAVCWYTCFLDWPTFLSSMLHRESIRPINLLLCSWLSPDCRRLWSWLNSSVPIAEVVKVILQGFECSWTLPAGYCFKQIWWAYFQVYVTWLMPSGQTSIHMNDMLQVRADTGIQPTQNQTN